MHEGYVKLYRKIRDTTLWPKNRPFTKNEAWIDMLMMARFNNEPENILLGNQIVICQRGQIVRSILTYQKRWNWGRQKVNSFFETLLKLKQILKKTTSKTSIITICNYDAYNDEQASRKQHINKTKTSFNHHVSIKKNDKKEKNDKNDKNNINTIPTNKFVREREILNNVYNLFDFEIINTLTEIEKNKWLDIINKLHKLDNYKYQDIEDTIIWGRNDDFWQSNFLSILGLRKKKNGITKFFQINKKMNHEQNGKNGFSNKENEFREFARILAEDIADDPDLK